MASARTLPVLGLVALTLWVAPLASAQTIPRPIRIDPSIYFGGFQFSGPGARAIGMGTAFIALADDATASEWNPAGLHIIAKPEVSLHGKTTDTESPLLVPYNNTFGTNEETVTGFSYASYAQSIGRFAFSIYRQELSNYESRGSFLSSGIPLYGTEQFDFTSSIDLKLDIVNYGASGSVTFFENELAIGYSVRYGQLDVDSLVQEDFFRKIDGHATARVDDDDTDVSYNLGVLWKPTQRFYLGAVYKSGPVFEVEQVETFGNFLKPGGSAPEVSTIEVPVPDSYGIGVAFRPLDQLTIVGDVVRIEYSDLNGALGDEIPDFLTDELDEAEDGTELHAGLEYVALTKVPVSMRLGIYSEPDRRSVIVRQGDDDLHYTGGLGVVLFENRFQIDVAADISDFQKSYVVSSIFRFGK